MTSNFDDGRTPASTRSTASGTSNAFNWLALNVGSGIRTIEVKADLTTDATQRASALAAVGKRTHVVRPTHAAVTEDVTPVARL